MEVLVKDVTERTQAEEARRADELRFRGTFENAAVGIAHVSLDGEWLLANSRLCEIVGYSHDELLRTTFQAITHPDDLATDLAHARRLLAGEIPHYSIDKRYVRADGGTVWARLTVSLLRDAHGAPVHFIAIVEDISEQKRIAEQLLHARDVAEAATRAKDRFLATLSHELRTPLSPALLLISEMLAAPGLPESVRRDGEIVRSNIEMQAQLVDDLLDMARIAQGKLAFTLAPTDPHEVLQHALDTVRAEFALKQVTVELSLSPEAILVSADPGRLRQAFWNVLRNAAKFTPPGGRVQIHSQIRDDRWTIAFQDNGVGINRTDLARIFEPFVQSDEGARTGYGGLGLGLAISTFIVAEHGGKISAESAGQGLGATFRIELPLLRQNPVRSASIPPAAARPDVPVSILLVEDHEPSRAALARLLAKRGHRVQSAGTTAEARSLAAQTRFDLVIADLGLPDGSGLDLMRELHEKTHVCGIALSGYGTESDIRAALDAGFVMHLTKPVSAAKLDDAMQRALAACRNSAAPNS